MEKFFEKLYSMELERNEETKLYTLGKKYDDLMFDLQQEMPNFAPAKESLENFVSATFLYGLFGYVATSYTSVAGGFLATYKKGESCATILICDNNTTYYVEPLIQLFQVAADDQTLSENERKFYGSMKSMLTYSPNQLMDTCAWAAEMINAMPELSTVKQNLQNAIFPFSSDKQSLNSKNCDDNHILLDNFCLEHLGVKKEEVTEQDLAAAQELRTEILSAWILPGYFTFMGRNREGTSIPQNNQILNDTENLEKLYNLEINGKKLENPRALAAIINMCTTDYSSDAVYDMLQILSNTIDANEALDAVENYTPDPPNNHEEVGARRHEFHDLTKPI